MGRVQTSYERHGIHFLSFPPGIELTGLEFQWLHYLLRKLISSKGLRAPRAPRKTPASKSTQKKKSKAAPTTTSDFGERQCYECLLEMDFLLGAWLKSVKPVRPKGTKKGKTKVPAAVRPAVGEEVRPFRSAGDVLGYGVERTWVAGDH